jgi:hypothetical protein
MDTVFIINKLYVGDGEEKEKNTHKQKQSSGTGRRATKKREKIALLFLTESQ